MVKSTERTSIKKNPGTIVIQIYSIATSIWKKNKAVQTPQTGHMLPAGSVFETPIGPLVTTQAMSAFELKV